MLWCWVGLWIPSHSRLCINGASEPGRLTGGCVCQWVNCCLQQILNIDWPEVISNQELWKRTGEIKMSTQIKRRRWNWIGRTGHEAIEREALDWNPQGKRRRGRPRRTWRRTVHNEALEKGKSWSEVKRMAGNRTRWRCFVDAVCPLRDNRNWWWWWWWCLTVLGPPPQDLHYPEDFNL